MSHPLDPLDPTTEGDTSAGAVGYGHQGYPAYADFVDLYGSRVRVQFSSRAFHPACWVWVKAERPGSGGVREHGSGHLTLPQAVALRDGLTAFIAQAEAQIASGSYRSAARATGTAPRTSSSRTPSGGTMAWRTASGAGSTTRCVAVRASASPRATTRRTSSPPTKHRFRWPPLL